MGWLALLIAALVAPPGDTVVWINRDIVPHTATATGKGRVGWDTGQLVQGTAGRYVAGKAGTIRYTCTLHPTMQGTLVIK